MHLSSIGEQCTSESAVSQYFILNDVVQHCGKCGVALFMLLSNSYRMASFIKLTWQSVVKVC